MVDISAKADRIDRSVKDARSLDAVAAQSPTPDIIACEPGAYEVDLYTNKTIIGFNKVFEADPEYKKGFWENALQLLTIDGEVGSVPVVTNTYVVYYKRPGGFR